MKKFLLFAAAFLLTAPALFAEDAAENARPSGSMWQTVIMIGIAIVFFYFILWRPEQKRRKAQEKQRSSLKKGDRVTAMGIVGTVAKIQENTIILRMVDGSKIEMLKGAITEVQPGTEEETKVEKEDEVASVK